MPVTLPDELRTPLLGVVQVELIGAPALLAILFPAIAADVEPGAPSYVAGEALRIAEERQALGQGDGPLFDLGNVLKGNGKSIGDDLLAWLAMAGKAVAAGGSPYDDVRVGGFGRPLLDHYTYRGHLRLALEGDRQAVWVPRPLVDLERRRLNELVLHVGARNNLRVGTAEWRDGIGLTPGLVAERVARGFTKAKPDPSATTEAAYLDYLAGWLYDEAATADRDGVFVFSGFEPPGAKDCLHLIAELIDLVVGTVPGDRRVRVVLLGCEFGSELSGKVGHVPKTQEQHLDEAGQARLQSDLRTLLGSLEHDGVLEDGVADQIFGDIWSVPPDLHGMHSALEAILAR